MLLKHILSCFSAKLYCEHARSMVALINEANQSLVTKAQVFAVLADALKEHPPPREQRLPLLNDAWRVVTQLEAPGLYTKCVASFIGLLLKHYTVRNGMNFWALPVVDCYVRRKSNCHVTAAGT